MFLHVRVLDETNAGEFKDPPYTCKDYEKENIRDECNVTQIIYIPSS